MASNNLVVEGVVVLVSEVLHDSIQGVGTVF